jgi:hypothetical protein
LIRATKTEIGNENRMRKFFKNRLSCRIQTVDSNFDLFQRAISDILDLPKTALSPRLVFETWTFRTATLGRYSTITGFAAGDDGVGPELLEEL